MPDDDEVESQSTTDNDRIREWAEERGGSPAVVEGTGEKGEGEGLLRIDFDGEGDEENLEQISWDEFLETFEEKNLKFLYQEETTEGDESRFFKFVNP